jgi:hypothetical protein
MIRNIFWFKLESFLEPNALSFKEWINFWIALLYMQWVFNVVPSLDPYFRLKLDQLHQWYHDMELGGGCVGVIRILKCAIIKLKFPKRFR